MKRLKLASLLTASGLTVLVIGLWFRLPALYAWADSTWRTHQIATAPALTDLAPASAPAPLLPFAAEGTPGTTETPLPTPLTLPPTPLPVVTTPTPAAITPWPTPRFPGTAPVRLRIPALHLDAPIVAVNLEKVEINGQSLAIWSVPDHKAAGWHSTSALLQAGGNTVLNGHNTGKGEVFRDLYRLEPGALILVDGENGETYAYTVHEIYVLPEAGQPLEVRLRHAQYIQPTADERLTLVTCHPYGSLRNRLVVIALPATRPALIPEGE